MATQHSNAPDRVNDATLEGLDGFYRAAEGILDGIKEEKRLAGAINWGDLGIAEVAFVVSHPDMWQNPYYLLVVEEANSPELEKVLFDGLRDLGYTEIEVRSEW